MALELGDVVAMMGGPGGLELIHDQTEGLTNAPSWNNELHTLAHFDVPESGAIIVRLDASVGKFSADYNRTISALRDGVLVASKWYSGNRILHPVGAGFHLSFTGQAGRHLLTYQNSESLGNTSFSPTRLRVYLARGLAL